MQTLAQQIVKELLALADEEGGLYADRMVERVQSVLDADAADGSSEGNGGFDPVYFGEFMATFGQSNTKLAERT